MKKLLLDENISQKVIAHISLMYSGSAHVKDFGLGQTDDDIIWRFAKKMITSLCQKTLIFTRKFCFGDLHPN